MDLRLYRYIAGAAARSTHARAASSSSVSAVSAALLPPAPPSSYIIFPGQQGVPHEEEIFLDGHRAVWSTGHVALSDDDDFAADSPSPSAPLTRVLKSYTHSEPILYALFTRFASLSSSSPSSSSSRPHLVLVHADSLSVHSSGGDIFSVPLPFRVAAALPLQEGLLLSRAPHLPAPAVALPCFFSLLHPLEEVKPVARTRAAAADGSSSSEYCCDEEERLVWSSDQEPLAVTFNAGDGKHRLHIIRQSERERRKRWTGDGSDDEEDDDRGGHDQQGADSDAMMDTHGVAAQPFSADADAEDERLISSELLLEQAACVELSASQPASSVFLSAGADGRALVCLCIETTLFVYELLPAASSFSPFAIAAVPAFALDALSACPTRPLFSSASSAQRAYHSDIVVLRPDHSIAVYSGQQLLLRLPSLQLPSPPLSLSHAVLSRLCVHTAYDSYRITLPPATFNACVLQCMQALSYGVPLQEMLQLRRAWLMLKERDNEDAQRESAVDRDWALFCSFIADAMGTASASSSPAPQPPVSSAFLSASAFASSRPVNLSSPSRKSTRHTRQLSQSPPPDAAAEDAGDAWTQLLSSDYHRQHANDPILHSLSASSRILPRASPAYTARDSKRQKMQPSVSSSFLLSAASRHAALLMLHLLYEDSKLDALQQPALAPLAALCSALAVRLGAREWCEWYARDYPELDGADGAGMTGSAPSLPPLLAQPPPSIFRWLHQRMSPSSSLPPAVYPLPSLSLADAESPFELSRRVCLCFELLTEPSLRHSRYSRHPPPSGLSVSEQSSSSGSGSGSFVPPPQLLSTPRSPFPADRRRSHRRTPQSVTSAASARLARSATVTAGSHPLFTPSSSSSRRRFASLTPATEASPASASSPALSALLESFSSSRLSLLPFGVSLPLYQLLHDARAAPSASLSPSELELIGRRELSLMKRTTAASAAASFSPSLQDKMEAAAGRPQLLTVPTAATGAADDDTADADGTLLTLRQASFRFGSDLRLKQVRHLLRSSRVVSLSLTRARLTEIEASNGALDLLFEQQKRLALLSRRILALPIARGMFTLASTSPLLTSTFPIPPLTLSARVQPKQTTIDLNLAMQPADFTDWPSFHNGVAAALRIRPAAPASSSASFSPLSSASSSSSSISSSFILYNKPATLSYSHGGWLLGLGLLCGGLSCLSTADVYRYLSAHHEGVTIGLLLGLSCARRRSMDVMVSKMLCLHVPAFLPAHLESEISLQVKTAAVVGIGLLYEGSAHRLMTEVLLGEISSRAAKEKVKGEGERSGYALAAGLGLGLVLLGRGAEAVGVSDLRIEDRLIALLQGGLKETEDNETAASGGAGGGLLLDVDITAPAATVALSLMYLGSNNADIASHLLIPQSHYELDAVKTDFLLLRTLARALILWDDVQPSKDWVEKQLPLVMTENVLTMEQYCTWPADSPPAGNRSVNAEKLQTQAVAAASSSAAAKEGGEHGTTVDDFDIDSIALDSDDERAYSARQPQPRAAGRRPSARRESAESDSDEEDEEDEVDYEACRQGYCNIIAGCCLALGLKFAGTADASACTVIAYYLRCFRAIRQRHSDGSHALLTSAPSPLQLLDRHTLETCLLSCMLALAAVLAGTGDLQTLRLFLSLRQRMDERQTVSRIQAFWMAFGLLFLGGGEWSLKRGKEAVPGLLLSLYPMFSASPSTSENRLHLQGLRHLYALSVECRAMKAVDVEGEKESYCQLQLRLKDSDRILHLVTPCTLPHIGSIHSVTVVDPRYLPITVTFASSVSSAAAASSPSSFTFPLTTPSPYVLHVQRCSAYVLRDVDSASFVELLSRLSQQRETRLVDATTAAASLPLAASDSGLAAGEDSRMMQAVCDNEDVLTAYRWIVGEEAEDRDEEAALLLDCVREDKLHLLPLSLRMRRLLSSRQQPGSIDASAIWNLRCLLAFYQSRLQTAAPSSSSLPPQQPPLLSPSSLSASEQRLLSLCGALAAESVQLLRGYVEGRDAGEQRREQAAYLTCFDLPSAAALRAAIAVMRQLLSELSAGRIEMLRADVQNLLPMASMLFPRLSAAAAQQVMAVVLDTS